MGEHRTIELSDERLRAYTAALLADLRALERMIEQEQFEQGVRRIGAEQEMFLVDAQGRPSPVAVRALERADDPRLTTELARFNLEANLPPQLFGPGCLRELRRELDDVLAVVARAAEPEGARVLLAGSLPTLREADLSLEMITPQERYYALNRAMRAMRGGSFHVLIMGLDELEMTHDNVMLESCNTSFQLHWQVSPSEMAAAYNVAQLISAPLLAAAVNSPVLLGRRLWPESRVALFQQSVDVRPVDARQQASRVTFGHEWMSDGVVELFRDNIARFRPVLDAAEGTAEGERRPDPLELLERGQVPALRALCLHNGTIYRWNRPCYGTQGPHLRIENRVLPAGPSVPDAVANAALFFGLMAELPQQLGKIRERIRFDEAKENFLAAARGGLKAELIWLDGRRVAVCDLLSSELIGIAREGLLGAGVERKDVDLYLGIIAERVRGRQTGSRWVFDSLAAMSEKAAPGQRHRSLVAAMVEHQAAHEPVHQWALCDLGDVDAVSASTTVAQIMTTELFTVRPDDLVDLAVSLMDWEKIRHIPVEDGHGQLLGLVTYRDLLERVARGEAGEVAVRSIMQQQPLWIGDDAPLLEAMRLMRDNRVSGLPVVRDGKLVGIVTDHDLLSAATQFFEEHFGA